uniref:Uncharacterized protein n=1 Tax=Magallana gigas TaxID=29159 RepID=K1PRX1_MAGGI
MSGKFFKCGFCDEAFAEAEELNWHLREHSSFNRMQPEKRQKPCQEFKGAMNPIDCNCEGYASNTKHGASCVKVRVFFKAGNSYKLDARKAETCLEADLTAYIFCVFIATTQ